MMIARDVLKWLSPRYRGNVNIIPMGGTYFNARRSSTESFNSCQLEEAAKSGAKCEVCALGAFLVAKALRMDNITTSYPYDDRDMKRIFGVRQMTSIEKAFECDYEKTYGVDSLSRLKSICRNIIKNKGKFVPVA